MSQRNQSFAVNTVSQFGCIHKP